MKKRSIISIGLFLSLGLSSATYAEPQQHFTDASVEQTRVISQHKKNIKSARCVDIEYAVSQQPQANNSTTSHSKRSRLKRHGLL
ncbi:MAG: hypothetical protein KAG34_02905 [Cocleimonas sp.]|nr:hypothetical protein [Cocleimonas sp.]